MPDGIAPRPRDASPPVPGAAVTFQIDPAHSGGQPDSKLRPPLKRAWSVTLPGRSPSYALIADGAVFLTASGTVIGNSGVKLYAFSQADGSLLWDPIDLGSNGRGSPANAAWDAGKVFVINANGVVSAFDAATGALLWTRTLVDSISVGAPVAANGTLFVVQEATLFALDEGSGATLWTALEGGDPTSPAYTAGTVILEYILGLTTALDARSGSTIWRTKGCCSGGGGDVPVIYRNQVYALDFWKEASDVIDLASGNVLATFSASTVPAFENGLGFFLTTGALESRDLNGTVRWSFAGDGKLASTPLAAGGVVYEGSSSGTLYAIDETSGALLWTDDLGSSVAPANETLGLWPTVGLAASLDLLVVPAGSTVTAYANDPSREAGIVDGLTGDNSALPENDAGANAVDASSPRASTEAQIRRALRAPTQGP